MGNNLLPFRLEHPAHTVGVTQPSAGVAQVVVIIRRCAGSEDSVFD